MRAPRLTWNEATVLVSALVVFGAVGWWYFAVWPDQTSPASPLANSPTSSTPNDVFFSRPVDGSLHVVFAGDSITYGLYASSEAKGYRPLVVDALERGGPVEASRGGQTGNTVATAGQSITFPKGTDLVVLELGTNDAWKTELEAYNAAYSQLVAKVQRQAPDAALVCLGVWGNVDAARNYDAGIRRACAGAGGRFVPLTDLFDDTDMRGPAGRSTFGGTSDDFHPNDRGYSSIAHRLLSALES